MPDAVELADEYWSYYRSTAQLWNIDQGDVDQIAYWEDLSPRGVTNRIEQLTAFASRAVAMESDEPSERDLGLLAAVKFSAEATVANLPYERDIGLVAGPFNFAAFVTVLVPGYSLATAEHGRGYVAKLRAMPSFIDGWIEGVRDGAAAGRVTTARGIAAAIDSYDALLSRQLSDDPLASQDPPSELSDSEIAEWQAAVTNAIRDGARPALAQIRAFLHDELLPVAMSDEQCGLCHLPGGDEGYARLLWAATSTTLTADAIHDIGLQQLALLDDEYRQLGPLAIGIEDPVVLRERLRADPTLRYSTADEIVADAMAAVARAEAEVPRWFGRLPRSDCHAVAVSSGPMAFYTGPSPDGNRGGTYFFNTANPSAWSRFLLEVTTFHEAVPGHHLQLAIAHECDLHPVVGALEVASYGEGWGLYAERLADEMDLYSSPLQRLGMLSLDSLRAARLVVDTGIHAMGWTRADAIEFLLAHTTMDQRLAETETDRYIAQPSQATSYMIGRLEIDRLRRIAEQRLGAAFSIKQFHDVVLGNGMTPLHQLARNVEMWLDA